MKRLKIINKWIVAEDIYYLNIENSIDITKIISIIPIYIYIYNNM